MVKETSALAELFRKANGGEPWYGSSIEQLLSPVSAEQAAAKPVGAAHSIWELVLHVAAWQGEVAKRLEGAKPGTPPEGDWPEVGPVGGAAWTAAKKRLDDSFETVARTLEGLRAGRLDELAGTKPGSPTCRETAIGLLQHTAYHSGQIALLRKALGIEG